MKRDWDLIRLLLVELEVSEGNLFTRDVIGYPDEDITRSSKGRSGGTWLHPKLAVSFARWLDVDFAVWWDLHIDALLHGELNEKQQFERACRALEDAQQVASLGGRALSKFRRGKPRLVHDVDHWREQLQMTLGLDTA